MLAPGATARGPAMVRVQGARLIGVNGKPLRLIGVNRSGTEYSCAGPVDGGGFGYGIFQGPADARSVQALLSWHVNAVALPLNEACWLGGYGNLNPQYVGDAYRRAIVDYVGLLAGAGIYVVLRLSGAAPGDNAYGSSTVSSDESPMADADHSVAFWRSVAATFRGYRRVLFHAYDEPHDVSWQCLRDGCPAVDAPGGQTRFGSYQTAGDQVAGRRDSRHRGQAADLSSPARSSPATSVSGSASPHLTPAANWWPMCRRSTTPTTSSRTRASCAASPAGTP